MEIRFSWIRGKLRVKMPQDPVTGLEFSGEIVAGHGPVRYFALQGEHNDERLLFVINDPLNPMFVTTNGVFAGVDMKSSTPVTGRVLLSKRCLTEDTAKGLLESRRFMRVSALIYPAPNNVVDRDAPQAACP